MGVTLKKGNLQKEEILQTEGEKHLQNLVEKQLNTDITLSQQFAQHKTFKKAGEYDPEIRSLSGVTGLAEYKSLGNRDVYIEQLKQCGLTKEEIELKLGSDNLLSKTSKYGINPQVEQERLQKVELKISECQKQLSKPDTFTGVVHLGRHQMELEKSLININKETKTVSDALTKPKPQTIGDPNDPINQLPDILRCVQEKAKEETLKRRKRRHMYCADPGDVEKQSELIGPLLPACNDEDVSSQDVTSAHPDVTDESLSNCTRSWDTVSADSVSDRPPDTASDKPSDTASDKPSDTSPDELDDTISDKTSDKTSDTASAKPPDTNHNGPRQLKTHVEFVPEDVIKKYRLTENDIRNLPRFSNYSTGDPSNVLYVKNLSSLVTEEDLVSLFGRFQKTEEKTIVYKLMSGRMRGQAFITFPDVSTASSALELVNGYHFKGKPVIIQYGKKG